MRKVIVNSTPLIILSRINHLSILKELYEEIIIPQAVFNEVTNKEDFVCRQILKNLNWIKYLNAKILTEECIRQNCTRVKLK